MTAEYKCLFGISSPIPELEPGMSDDTFAQGVSLVVSSGKQGKLFWFLFGHLPRAVSGDGIPRFDAGDADQFARENRDLPVRPGITFGDLWRRRRVATLVPLEEADFAHWTAGRIVCLGDSAHKMTPHTGSGAMLAIEHAAALANILCRSVESSNCRTTAEIEAMLRQYDHPARHCRASAKIKSAAALARMQSLHTLLDRALVRWFVPYTGDLRADQFCDEAIGAEALEYLPLPARSLTGTMPFNPLHGIGRHEELARRAIRALPLLAMALAAGLLMASVAPFQGASDIVASRRYGDVQIREKFYHIPWLDDFSRPGVLRFLVSERHFFFQGVSLFVDYGIWYAILLIESARRANRVSVLRFALIWGTLNMWGIGVFVPVYQFAHYLLTPISAFDAPDMRLTDLSYVRTILPTLLLTHYVPSITAYAGLTPSLRQSAAYAWELLPVWVCLAQEILARYVLSPSTVQQDRLKSPLADLPTIRRTILPLCLVSAVVWQYTLWGSGRVQPLADIFLPVIGSTSTLSFEQLFAEFLKVGPGLFCPF
ncbi:hypothetical protein BDV10DRAFT_180047 [Aspergillus recurvatus]